MQKVQGNFEEVQKIAMNLNILTKTTVKKVLEGWVGKLKGMMQVLWERGFLDPAKNSKELTRSFSKDFKKDKEIDEDIPCTSLREIIENLLNFN